MVLKGLGIGDQIPLPKNPLSQWLLLWTHSTMILGTCHSFCSIFLSWFYLVHSAIGDCACRRAGNELQKVNFLIILLLTG